jgi:hypothetical protein
VNVPSKQAETFVAAPQAPREINDLTDEDVAAELMQLGPLPFEMPVRRELDPAGDQYLMIRHPSLVCPNLVSTPRSRLRRAGC